MAAFGFRSAILAGGIAVFVGACAPTVDTRGNLVELSRIAELEVGTSSRDDAIFFLGTPTTVSAFDDDVWYYIGQMTEKVAFFDAAPVERRIIAIRFDDQGTIVDLRVLDETDAIDVAVVSRETPTLGRELTLFEQLSGNIGRLGGGGGGRPTIPGP